MKKILLLLLLATFGMQAQTLQNPTYGNVKLKNNVTDNSATKVNVQSTDGTINTISKSDLVNVVEVNDVPSLPLVGEVGKIYVVKNLNKIYRWNGTFYQELADINNVKLTGDQTIYDTKTFNNLATGKISIAIEANSGGGGEGAIQINNKAQNFGLRIDQSNANYTSAGILIRNNNSSNSVLVDYTAPTGNGRAYEGRNRGVTTFLVDNLGEVSGSKFIKSSASANNFLLAGGGDIAQSDLPISSITQAALDLKANDSDVVKLTGDQTIDDYKTFTSTITATTSNNDDFAVNAFSDAGIGVKAASNTAAALLAESVSAPAAIFKTTSGSSIVRFRYGFDEKAYIDTNGGYVKSTVPSSNILLAGGGDLAQSTFHTGSLTSGYIPKATGVNSLGNGLIYDNGTNVGISTMNPSAKVTITDLTAGTTYNALAFGEKGFEANNYGSIFESDSFTGLFSLYNYNATVKSSNPVLVWSRLNGNVLINRTTDDEVNKLQVNGSISATSYTATSLPVFENNAAASSLAVGQFYRTSTGVLMIKF